MSAVRIYDPRRDEAEAAAVLGRAFARDPAVEYMLGTAPPLRQTTWLLRQGMRASDAEAGGGHISLVGDPIAGVATWIPPGCDPIPSFWRHMRLGGYGVFWRFPRALPAVLRRDADAEERYRRDLEQPEWVLDLLGVDPAHQDTGLGRRLVQAGLARADEGGVPVYLQTYRIENVAWYRTLGFEVVSDGSRGDVPRGWGMRRRPR